MLESKEWLDERLIAGRLVSDAEDVRRSTLAWRTILDPWLFPLDARVN